MKYQLALQWPAASLGDYDRMIAIETLIEDSLAGDGEVDGHDAGSGEVNIFVRTDAPERAFDRIRPVLVAENALRHTRRVPDTCRFYLQNSLARGPTDQE